MVVGLFFHKANYQRLNLFSGSVYFSLKITEIFILWERKAKANIPLKTANEINTKNIKCTCPTQRPNARDPTQPIFHWKWGSRWLPNANEIYAKKMKCTWLTQEI